MPSNTWSERNCWEMDFPHEFNLLNLMFIHVNVGEFEIYSRGSNHEVIEKFKISPLKRTTHLVVYYPLLFKFNQAVVPSNQAMKYVAVAVSACTCNRNWCLLTAIYSNLLSAERHFMQTEIFYWVRVVNACVCKLIRAINRKQICNFHISK